MASRGGGARETQPVPSQKKKQKTGDDDDDKGKEEEDASEARFKALEQKNETLSRELRELRSMVEHVLGISLKRRKNTKSKAQTTLDYTSGRAPPKTIVEVQFRDNEGGALYPGFDTALSTASKKARSTEGTAGGGGGPKTPKASGKARQASTAATTDMVYVEQLDSARDVLGIPFYAAMEQVKLNTQRLDYLNKAVVPILEQNQRLLAALATRTETGPVPPTLMLPVNGIRTIHAYPWPAARAPHLTATKAPGTALDATQEARDAELAREAALKTGESTVSTNTANNARTAAAEAQALARRMNIGGGGVNAGGGGGGALLLAMQSELKALREKTDALDGKITSLELDGMLGRPQFDPLSPGSFGGGGGGPDGGLFDI